MAAYCLVRLAEKCKFKNVDHRNHLEAKGFRDVEEIGSGNSGNVFQVLNSADGRRYAIKCVRKTDCDKEVEILQTTDHENIIKLYEVWTGSDARVGSALDLDNNKGADSSIQVTGESVTSQSEQIEQEEDIFDVSLSELGITPISFENDEHSADGVHHIRENNNLYFEGNNSASCCVAEEAEGGPVDSQEKSEECYVYMMLELCDGNLVDILFGKENYDPRTMFKSIVKGLEYLHTKMIIHNDLKSDNIFIKKLPKIGTVDNTGITEEIIPKIGDLGNATIWEDMDLFEMQQASDMTSLGRLAVCIVLQPENDDHATDICKAIIEGHYNDKFEEGWMIDLIRKMLVGSLSAKDVLSYLSEYEEKTPSSEKMDCSGDKMLESEFGIKLVVGQDDYPTDFDT